MKFTMKDKFWNKYTDLIRHEMIPYQWNVLHDLEDIVIDKERDDDNIPSEKSHAIKNLRIAAGLEEGNHYGWLFQDSDVYKWLEAAANSYAISPDDQLNEMMDEIVSLIEDAQDEDGYVSTYYQIEAPQFKFRRLFESHELYCFGHLIQAAIAHYKATGSERLLHVSDKLVDCIEANFGEEDGKINGADGHQEIELALVQLYELTKEKRYLDISEYFLNVRGQDPEFYKKQLQENVDMGLSEKVAPNINTVYHQAHQPVIEQVEAVGHAVRLVYMAASMAEVAYYTENKRLYETCKELWKNIVTKRMYVTGGIGSTVHGEAFTYDYDLPNDTMYCETCASIGMMYFANSMLKHEIDASYTDVLERCLYNTVISGMALDGKHFFYVNPLESDPEASCIDPGKSHVKNTRPSWFGCACCPPNIARTLTSLDQYAYTLKDDVVAVNLFMDSVSEVKVNDGSVIIEQETEFPYSGQVKLNITLNNLKKAKLAVRMPNWADNFQMEKNGEKVEYEAFNQYGLIELTDKKNEISLTFELPVIQWEAHPKVKANTGKISLQRGPFVYCLEEEDNTDDLHLVRLTDATITEKRMKDSELGDIIVLQTTGEKEIISESWKNILYKKQTETEFTPIELTFVPYYTWANRSNGEMTVWVNKKGD